MIDLIVRDCGYGEWLPLIVVTATGAELFRGSRLPNRDAAYDKAVSTWEESGTGNIIDFKKANGLA
jgi:hypothetical protein